MLIGAVESSSWRWRIEVMHVWSRKEWREEKGEKKGKERDRKKS